MKRKKKWVIICAAFALIALCVFYFTVLYRHPATNNWIIAHHSGYLDNATNGKWKITGYTEERKTNLLLPAPMFDDKWAVYDIQYTDASGQKHTFQFYDYYTGEKTERSDHFYSQLQSHIDRRVTGLFFDQLEAQTPEYAMYGHSELPSGLMVEDRAIQVVFAASSYRLEDSIPLLSLTDQEIAADPRLYFLYFMRHENQDSFQEASELSEKVRAQIVEVLGFECNFISLQLRTNSDDRNAPELYTLAYLKDEDITSALQGMNLTEAQAEFERLLLASA